MSQITAFNHPLYSAPSTSNASSLPAAAAIPACNQLTALKAKNFDELMDLAAQVFTGQEDLQSTMSSIMNAIASGPIVHQLAEAIYFRQGHTFVMQYRIDDITRLQQEHEAVAAGIATPDALAGMSDFVLRQRLSSWVSSLGLAEMEVDIDSFSSSSSSSYSSDEDDDFKEPMKEDSQDSGYESKSPDMETNEENDYDGFESMDENTDYESDDDKKLI
ncbi:uncharacterized protein CC84DRAFT_1173755 [Paraphaeosphaeria sporulosa]|uniref:Uncharacterized protein n=1 Tax=Paraphaeosphaeria sporulosa TaxID=1460663 RepID=A0A177CNB0_9PLEO|nr:uncharacterized protein CC84DRAFT_1173755 [Paraphaeosphaeria sporulosa]OAG08237.1 hypothetical protein CC84DRAFT_1173755 [Paraphaeosphaeria sporulosa]